MSRLKFFLQARRMSLTEAKYLLGGGWNGWILEAVAKQPLFFDAASCAVVAALAIQVTTLFCANGLCFLARRF